MDNILSNARRAPSSTSEGTSICVQFSARQRCKEARSVFFMLGHSSKGDARKNSLPGFSFRKRCSRPSSVPMINDAAGSVWTKRSIPCLLYTSDADDDLLCVDLGG